MATSIEILDYVTDKSIPFWYEVRSFLYISWSFWYILWRFGNKEDKLVTNFYGFSKSLPNERNECVGRLNERSEVTKQRVIRRIHETKCM